MFFDEKNHDQYFLQIFGQLNDSNANCFKKVQKKGISGLNNGLFFGPKCRNMFEIMFHLKKDRLKPYMIKLERKN